MIDLHTHILPQLDDGSQSLQESLQMAQIAVSSGVAAMTATPHCTGDRFDQVYDKWQLLSSTLQQEQIPLKLYLGMEIFASRDTLHLLQQKKLFTINNSRYPLVEFDFLSDEGEMNHILKELTEAGYRPLIAHPERYVCLQRRPELANRWYRMGCQFQINRGSFLGRFGADARHMAFSMVGRGLAAVVASDAHSAKRRTPWMDDIRRLLSDEFSPLAAECLLHKNPYAILHDEQLERKEPIWF